MRRSPRSGRLLARRYELVRADECVRPYAIVDDFGGEKAYTALESEPMNPLRWILHFMFGCHHSHMSRVFTIKGRTYKVCFDCGEEFDLPDTHASEAA